MADGKYLPAARQHIGCCCGLVPATFAIILDVLLDLSPNRPVGLHPVVPFPGYAGSRRWVAKTLDILGGMAQNKRAMRVFVPARPPLFVTLSLPAATGGLNYFCKTLFPLSFSTKPMISLRSHFGRIPGALIARGSRPDLSHRSDVLLDISSISSTLDRPINVICCTSFTFVGCCNCLFWVKLAHSNPPVNEKANNNK
jgi:hypothetical protein